MLNRFILFIFLCAPLSFFAQSFNGGFEQGFSDGTTLGWSTPDPSGANTSSDALSGKKAAKAWIFTYYNIGSWVSLTSTDDFIPEAGGAPVLPTKVTGYYKYEGESAECDMADISLLIGKRNDMGQVDTLAFGATELKLSARYRYFEFPVSGDPGLDASFVSLKFSPAGRCNNHGGNTCCFLYVDDIELLPNPNGEEAAEEQEVPKTALQPIVSNKPKGKVLGRKARGRKARLERKKRREEGFKPSPKPASTTRPAETKPKVEAKTVAEPEEDKIPDHIQKEIDRIRKVQEEELDKQNGEEFEATEEDDAPATEEVEETPANEVDEIPVESGWETEESSDDGH